MSDSYPTHGEGKPKLKQTGASRRGFLKTAGAVGALALTGIGSGAPTPEPQGHRTYMTVEETDGIETEYTITVTTNDVQKYADTESDDSIIDYSSYSLVGGTVNGGKDEYYMSDNTVISQIDVWGSGNVNVNLSGGLDASPDGEIHVEGLDYDGDSDSPSMAYSISPAEGLVKGNNLEGNDSGNSGYVAPGGRDSYYMKGQFESAHLSPEQGEQIRMAREGLDGGY